MGACEEVATCRTQELGWRSTQGGCGHLMRGC